MEFKVGGWIRIINPEFTPTLTHGIYRVSNTFRRPQDGCYVYFNKDHTHWPMVLGDIEVVLPESLSNIERLIYGID